jgi:CheY-like chemotaxis protein
MAQSRPRILVVDDVEDNVFTVERRLKQFLDPEITSAGNGRVALEKLRAQTFDLVLLDVQMPELDGVTALEQMKADMSLREVPVIMVSAVDDFQTVLRCIKLGADDYVQKPFNADLLRARVETALERKRLRDQEGLFVQQLREEKARVNELLHSLLPKTLVSELKAKGRPQARRHEDVAVLFCDIVGFTEYCDGNPPEQVVGELETLVATFEEVVEAHGLEKIKTIGDAFMATAGLLRYVENPAALRQKVVSSDVTDDLPPSDRELIEQHLRRVQVRSGSVLIEVAPAPDEETESAGRTTPAAVITVPWSVPPLRARCEIVTPTTPDVEDLRPMRSLLVAIAKARRWFVELSSGQTASFALLGSAAQP